MTDINQIKHMVNRFLAWKLPETFNPDGGITFKREFNEHTAHPMKHDPSGTNLLDATQAEAMVRHMLEGIPDASADLIEVLHECEEYFDNRADADCDQDGFIPNKEMTLLSAVRDAIASAERHAVIINNSHVHPVFQPILAAIAPKKETPSAALDLLDASRRALAMIELLTATAYQIGLEGTKEWDELAVRSDIQGTADVLRAAVSKAEGK